MSTNDDSLLSAAVPAFLGWPTAKMPLADENAVAAVMDLLAQGMD